MDANAVALASLIQGQCIPPGSHQTATGPDPAIISTASVSTIDGANSDSTANYLSSLQGWLQSYGAVNQTISDGQSLPAASAAPSSAAATNTFSENAAQRSASASAMDAALQAQLQSQLLAALTRTPSVQPVTSVQTIPDVLKLHQPSPALTITDSAQLTALLTVMQEPKGQPKYPYVAKTGSGSSGLDSVSSGRIAKASSPGPDETIGGTHAREKNRQAQQRFRQRQKDRIQQLEDENNQLQQQLVASQQQLVASQQQLAAVQQQAAALQEENRLLKAQLEAHGHVLGTIQ